MKIIKTIVYFIFWIIDLIVPEELLLKILNYSKNKLFNSFLSYKVKLMLEKNQPEYWKTRSAIYYFIFVKNTKFSYFFSSNLSKSFGSNFIILKFKLFSSSDNISKRIGKSKMTKF